MAQSNFLSQQFSSEEFVESCGAILFDLTNPQHKTVCLVNFIRKDEWLLAKGRRNIGESRQDVAIREVSEETGYTSHLLPVAMPTRACNPAAAANVSDKSRMQDSLTEPFMFTFRELGGGKENKGPGEKHFKARFFACEEAIDKLKFENDKQVLRKAVMIIEDTIARAGTH